MELPWDHLLTVLPHNYTVCRGILGPLVATQGDGPCDEREFDDFLDHCGIGVQFVTNQDSPPSVVVFGRVGWEERDVDLLRERTEGGAVVRVYSQEMVFASLALGCDIYEVSEGEASELIDSFIDGHPALERFFRIEAEPDVGVATFPEVPLVAPGSNRKLIVNLDAGDWPTSGVLGALGYRVGRNGLRESARRAILEATLGVELVAGSKAAEEYIRQWGPPNSVRRLQKMVNSIAAFARNAKRRSADFSEAIADWESDLRWLEANYG